MALTITVYGGAGEIGGNKILLEDRDTRVFLDFGMSLGTRSLYYEDFLAPRAGLGILDPLVMGLLPPLPGLYRDDLIPSAEVWERLRDHPHYREISEVHGVLLTHAHLDHSGAIPFLKETIPIHATRITAFIAKAMQDVGGSDFEREVTYITPRAATEDGVLAADRSGVSVRRPFAFVDGAPVRPEARDFWAASAHKNRRLEAGAHTAAGRVGNLPVRYHYVDHSIFGACAFAVETSVGWVVYTGDLRLHGTHGELTEAFVREAAALRPAVLLCEGTNVGKETQIGEGQVYENALDLLREAKGLVIADFGPRNIERLLTFYWIAQKIGRSLVILAKDQYLLDAMRLAGGGPWKLDEMSDVLIYDERRVSRSAVEERIREGYAARMLPPDEVRRDPDRYLLCLSFLDIKHLIDIDPPAGGLYVYSSSEPYGEEQRIDQNRLRNWLARFQLRPLGFDGGQGLHASGHAGGEDLLRVVRGIGPRVLIPVHTQDPDFYSEGLATTQTHVMNPQPGIPIPF
jgi:ribonuclease J